MRRGHILARAGLAPSTCLTRTLFLSLLPVLMPHHHPLSQHPLTIPTPDPHHHYQGNCHIPSLVAHRAVLPLHHPRQQAQSRRD